MLFNGIWRLRVTKVEAVADPDGTPTYHVSAQISNGTSNTLDPDSTGIQTGHAYNIFMANGDSVAAPTSTSVSFQDKTWAKLPQEAGENLEFLVPPCRPSDARSAESKHVTEISVGGQG